MDINIRKIDRKIVAIIDDLARKQNKSRNEFLKIVLENFANSEALSHERNRLTETYEKVGNVLGTQIQNLEQLNKSHEKLFNLIAMSMELSPEEVEVYLKI